MTGQVDAKGLAMLAGKDSHGMSRGDVPARTYPPKQPVPFTDYATVLSACGRSSELLEQLVGLVKFYEGPGKVTQAAEAHRRYLRSLGAKP